jgi:acetyltransferase
VISAGFSEVGSEGKRLEETAISMAREHGIRVVGPNCLGLLSLHGNLNASFATEMPPKGPIAFISQSGALCTAVIRYARQEGIGFSNFVSTGNKADVDDNDLLYYCAEDPHTRCIGLYIESIKHGRSFHNTLSEVARQKPVVVLKSGRTSFGVSAAQSHTGSLAGFDRAYDAAFLQAGVHRVMTIYELFDALRALAYQPPPSGDAIAILTNAGGPGVIAADVAYELGLPLAELSKTTIEKLDEICPPSWSKRNPVDILGDAPPDRYERALDILKNAEEVHGILLIMTPQAMTEPIDVAKKTVTQMKTSRKPVIASFMGLLSDESEDYLEQHGIPEIEFPERAIVALNALVARGRVLRLWRAQ